VLGWVASADQWNRTLRRRGGNFIVQARAEGCAHRYPVDYATGLEWQDLVADCGPYVWNSRMVSGWLARASTTGRHNIGNGAMNVPLWIVR
jgi:hypothetical protein